MNPQKNQNEQGTIIENTPEQKPKPRFVKTTAILAIIGLVGFISGIVLYLIDREPGFLAISGASLLVIARANRLRHHTSDEFEKMYKNDPKVKKMTWIGLAISFLIIVTIIALALIFGTKDTSDNNQSANTAKNATVESSENTVSAILFDIKNKISNEDNFNGYSMITRTNVANVPVYAEREAYFVMLDSPNGWDFIFEKSDYDTQSDSQDIADFTIEYLKAKNFKNYDNLTYDEISGEGSATYLVRNNELCIIATTPFEIDTECVNTDELGDEIAATKPFYTAFFSDENNAKSYDMKSIIIKIYDQSTNQTYPDYTVAKGVIFQDGSGSDVSFYKVNDGEWVYGINKREPLECKQYNSKDIQKAFNTDSCYAGSELTTVNKFHKL